MAQHITTDTATDFLAELADRRIVKTVKALIDSGEAQWLWDPQVDNVLGLTPVGDPTVALLVIYVADRDFEVSTTLEVKVYGG